MTSIRQFKSFMIIWPLLLFFNGVYSKNISIESPAAHTTVPVNEPFSITWTVGAGSGSSVQIVLWIDDQIVTNITGSTPNNGSFLWTPVNAFASSSNCFLEICPDDVSPQDSDDCDYTSGGRFAIGGVSSSTSSIHSSSSTISSSAPSSTRSVVVLVSQTSTPTSTTTQTSPTTSDSSNSSGLSTATKAAISIPIFVFVIAVAVIIGLLLERKNKASKAITTNMTVHKTGSEGYQKAELPANCVKLNRIELQS